MTPLRIFLIETTAGLIVLAVVAVLCLIGLGVL